MLFTNAKEQLEHHEFMITTPGHIFFGLLNDISFACRVSPAPGVIPRISF